MDLDRCSAPVGVFDSGVGGLSVLAALRSRLPRERFVYYADTGHAPYGERGDAFVIDRTLQVAEELVSRHGVKALVVACNTATAAAIHLLRAAWPGMPIVGVEPALKPALALTRTGQVAVLATRGTLASQKFGTLVERVVRAGQTVRTVACDGLADAIEQDDTAAIQMLCQRYIEQAGELGSAPGQADVVVLGCTHYPFAQAVLSRLAGNDVRFVETGEPVARQTARLLAAATLERQSVADERPKLLSSGDDQNLHRAVERWLLIPGLVSH